MYVSPFGGEELRRKLGSFLLPLLLLGSLRFGYLGSLIYCTV